MPIRVEYNETYDEWDIDSGAPQWVHTAADTRREAIQIARRHARDGEQIIVKGPRMNSFKPV